MEIAQACYRILEELSHTIDASEVSGTTKLIEAIEQAGRVFVAGAGRSGLMMRAFAMRLMQVGIDTYVVGETTTPGLTAKDLLIVGSGSGRTGGPLNYAQIAKHSGARVFAVSAAESSPLADVAEVTVRLPAPTPRVHDNHTLEKTMQPLGTLFEQTLLVYLDAVIILLMQQRGVDSETLLKRHATLE
jgi:6-phospho-3-hexuloisomerase